jgi:RNA 3'-terminal phosphate cyclase (ATP)
MLKIDGAIGEGGGQVLRTCLSLSLLTGQGFNLANIRAGRKKPGLRPQHLCAVQVAAKIGNARVEGAELNSSKLLFSPKSIQPGKYKCDIGTAGSTSLILQTIFLPLSFANSSSSIKISGGTHVPFSPSFEFIYQHWLYYMQKLGFQISLDLEQAGFYPRGGGIIRATIDPVDMISPLYINRRGSLIQIRGMSAVANLDRKIAERQRNQVIRRLGDRYPLNDIRIIQLPSRYKGTTICLICEFEHTQCCYFSLGALGKPAELVADEACDQIEYLMSTEATIDEHLADQLLLPLTFANSKSTYVTARITRHLITNAEILRLFLPAKIFIDGNENEAGTITINPPA